MTATGQTTTLVYMNTTPDSSRDRLDALDKITDGLTYKQLCEFHSLLVGTLAAHTDSDTWDECTALAAGLVK